MGAVASPSSRLSVVLITDIAGSVELKRRLGLGAYAALIARHDDIFRGILNATPGCEGVKDTGDGFFALFSTTSGAVTAALRLQHALAVEPWLEKGVIRVRAGLQVGEVAEVGADVDGRPKIVGLAADWAARLMGLALPGQILMTDAVFNDSRQTIRRHPAATVDASWELELEWRAHGPYRFKGSDEPVEVFEVGGKGEAPLAAPLDSDKARRAVAAGDEETLGWRPAVGQTIARLDEWVLERKLGEGGFGEVWLGVNRGTLERHVFKFCFDATRLRALKRELALFRVLREALGDRPDIARLYRVQLDEPPFFLESEFTEKGDLLAWSDAGGGIGALPLRTRLDLVARTADAVAAAHSVGVLHKDIKPANILIYEEVDGSPRPRLADFGIGVLTDRSRLDGRTVATTDLGLTEAGTAATSGSTTGTRMYLPPESLAGQPFTVQGDVFALGVLLYQMIVGDLRRPIAEGWEFDVSDPLLREDIARAVAGDPTKRFASATELARSLRTLGARRRSRWLRRAGYGSVAACIVLGLALLGGSAWATAQARGRLEAERLRENAVRERDRAMAAEEAMRDETRKAVTVSEFLRDLLMSADPGQAQGRDVTVREILDRTASQIDERFPDDPDVRVTLHDTVGTTYGSLGLLDDAEKHLQVALDLSIATYGRSHVQTLAVLNNLGLLLADRGRLREATAMLEEVLEARRRSGLEHPNTLKAESNLAEIHLDSERPEDAAPLIQHLLDVRRRMHGEDHPETLIAMNKMGNLLLDLNRRDEAESLLRTVYERRLERLGESHPETINAATNHARALRALGRLDEAETQVRAALAARRRVQGGKHPETLQTLTTLGSVLLEAEKAVEAEAAYREAMTACREVLGEEHYATYSSMRGLGQALSLQGRYEEAELLLLESLAGLRRTLGDDNDRVRLVMNNLADLYDAWERLAYARRYRAMLASETDSSATQPDDSGTPPSGG